ncbi:hypothetical protein L5515_012160 [Caenorhabditis briggsae]|uniref:Uncharacterized protein n=1 Tax=Caenorhabditis briggsae TaxID=6238 RepID=A0AAE9JHG8_CAEBR|nr:hypothetical protein L5515_012160 [Caenorhabditis briggsae]
MSPTVLGFLLSAFVLTSSTQIFSEDVGKIIIVQNTCSVVPHRVWKRFTEESSTTPKSLNQYSPETIKFLQTWIHTAHGVESRLENALLKWDEKSICFDRPSTITLKKVAHGGDFSNDMSKFSYLEVPEHWAAPNEDNMETWKNIKLEECSTTNDAIYRCPETAFKTSCSIKDLAKCSERIEMDSSDQFFAFVRRLGSSHLVATRARRGTIIRSGNIFDIKPVDLPERIFKLTLADTDMMSIGTALVKNQ